MSNSLKVFQSTSLPVLNYEIVNVFEHDSTAFTEGLFYYNGFIYESTGLAGRSSLRKVEIKSGQVMQKIELAPDFFAEGLTILDNKIYQLTYKNNTVFVYDLDFVKINEFGYVGEGWGLTTDSKNLIMSDGTACLRVLEPQSFTNNDVTSILIVNENGKLIDNINELEWINGNIWANIYGPPLVVIINYEKGSVKGWLNLREIFDKEARYPTNNLLNGIAYKKDSDTIIATGKNWKHLYELKVETIL